MHMTSHHRLGALITGAMLLLAVATTAESRRIDVTDTTPTAAVSVSTAERPAPAATTLDLPPGTNPYAAWSCGFTRPHEEYILDSAVPVAMGVYSGGVSWLRSTCRAHAEQRHCNWVSESRSNGVEFVYSGYNCVTVP